MTKMALAFLWRDLSKNLAGHCRRGPPDLSGAGIWLSRAGIGCLLAGSLLWLGGYQAGFLWLNGVGQYYPDWTWQWLTMLGDERMPFALGLLLARRRPQLLWTLALAALLAIAYSRGLKHVLDTLRPPAVLAADSFHLIGPSHRRLSFPSGHSTTAGLLAGVLIFHARRLETRTLLLALALLAGLSRVAIGVHWPVDVAFGLAGGLLAAWAGGRLSALWSGPACSPSVHLALIGLGIWSAVLLMASDGGYPLARRMTIGIGCAALLYWALAYVVLPLRRQPPASDAS